MNIIRTFFLTAITVIIIGCSVEDQEITNYDVIVRGGTIHDGLGNPGSIGDVAINADRIVAIGDLGSAKGTEEIDATGLVVAPGFINVLSHSMRNLIHDPRGMSELKQGVTLEIFGEGSSMGPITPRMREQEINNQGDIKYDIPWTTLGDYLSYMEQYGITPNVASFVGAGTVRQNEIGNENRLPTEDELLRMQQLVIDAMNEGALGVGSSLIYAPDSYSDTNELIALNKAASVCGGSYISHLRSEGNMFEAAVDELITIARDANIPAEIYHLKAAGKDNWVKLDPIIKKIEDARATGTKPTAPMYS